MFLDRGCPPAQHFDILSRITFAARKKASKAKAVIKRQLGNATFSSSFFLREEGEGGLKMQVLFAWTCFNVSHLTGG